MRQEFENELQAARSEVAKAQEALAGSEERIRAAEQVERARLETEYQNKLGAMQAELDRTRDEMAYRTMVMQVWINTFNIWSPCNQYVYNLTF